MGGGRAAKRVCYGSTRGGQFARAADGNAAVDCLQMVHHTLQVVWLVRRKGMQSAAVCALGAAVVESRHGVRLF